MAAHSAAGQKLDIDPFHHVIDNPHIELFESLGLHVYLPKIAGYQITRFHVFLALAAFLVAIAMIWLGKKMASGDNPRGKMWNMLESLLYFVKEKIAKPGLGEEADRYTPFLTTMFLFIFLVNLLGMIPFLGSATASIAVTFALALCSFIVIHTAGIKEMGFAKYIKSFVPHIHLEGGPAIKAMGFTITIGMAVLEYATAFIRLAVLAIRLFANMLAGHTALFMILFFIQYVSRPISDPMGGYLHEAPGWLYYVIAPVSVLLSIALSALELFVAGLQAFVFTLLTSIFIGLAKHPAH
ncbi:F0F1 ATP synthase subunit A [Limnoglobus roseus]|uniref:ATP synthase subunit a n=1 Tax=Limnoglobus roseus TaxID=2598579 RepID=A0A5C1AET3_9BACT|nr:F0F1 ATP synthase subunit A [Limnoglobus roseus]QEL17045.1 ATP synthase F0 subunit A [Limnoglobus roseus]